MTHEGGAPSLAQPGSTTLGVRDSELRKGDPTMSVWVVIDVHRIALDPVTAGETGLGRPGGTSLIWRRLGSLSPDLSLAFGLPNMQM